MLCLGIRPPATSGSYSAKLYTPYPAKARPLAIATGGSIPAEYRTERISGTLAAIAALVPGI